VPQYLVELYVARTDADTVERDASNAERAADELTRNGTPVRYLHSIFVPDDETCLLLFEAASVDHVREAARRAGLTSGRVTEAVADVRSGGTP
jgi:hypothetical protein